MGWVWVWRWRSAGWRGEVSFCWVLWCGLWMGVGEGVATVRGRRRGGRRPEGVELTEKEKRHWQALEMREGAWEQAALAKAGRVAVDAGAVDR